MKRIIVLITLISIAGKLAAQQADDTTQKTQFHLSLGSAMIGAGHGNSSSVFGIEPSVVYKPTDRLAVKASLGLYNTFSLAPAGGYRLQGHQPQSLDPVRYPGGHMAGKVNVSTAYKVSDRLWMAASLTHVSGRVASPLLVNPWMPDCGPMDINATAFSASLRYRIGDNSYIDINATILNDRTGAFAPLLYMNPYYGVFSHTQPLVNPYYDPFFQINR